MSFEGTDATPISFEQQRDVLIAYLKHKVDLADWHGVSDAANDLRVLEASHLATGDGHD